MGKHTGFFHRLLKALANEFERETGKKQVPGSPEWREWINRKLFGERPTDPPQGPQGPHETPAPTDAETKEKP